VELYPLSLRVVVPGQRTMDGKTGPPRSLTLTVSRGDTVGDLRKSICDESGYWPGRTRLWRRIGDKARGKLLEQLDDTIDNARIADGHVIEIEVQNFDGSWPTEGGAAESVVSSKSIARGLTGLENIGNTCFMNASLQCLSHTPPLRRYLVSGQWSKDVNRENPMGMGGDIAEQTASLFRKLWTEDHESYAPTKLKWTVGRYNTTFTGFQQHDAQEFLNFLLDGLHEDLNLVTHKPYIENPDSHGRDDASLALEFWNNYLHRNQSIITDVFTGQLKSQVKCQEEGCERTSVIFDSFTFLSLPLPMDEYRFLQVTHLPSDGGKPMRYGCRTPKVGIVLDLKKALQEVSGLDPSDIILVDLHGNASLSVIHDDQNLDCIREFDTVVAIDVIGPSAQILHRSKLKKAEAAAAAAKTSPTATAAAAIDELKASMGAEQRQGESQQQPKEEPQPVQQDTPDETQDKPTAVYIHVVHRRLETLEVSFIHDHRPVLFGTPTIISFPADKPIENAAVYAAVWPSVQSILGTIGAKERHTPSAPNSSFTLSVVGPTFLACGRCPWDKFCLGCPLSGSGTLQLPTRPSETVTIAVDWSAERLAGISCYYPLQNFDIHESVERNRALVEQPIALSECLKWFLQEEKLGDDDSWYCPGCKEFRPATKRIDLWRLPPLLIVHLKRFRFDGIWKKSCKLVQFDTQDLNLCVPPRI